MPNDFKKAVTWFEIIAVDYGHPKRAHKLAKMYEKSGGIA